MVNKSINELERYKNHLVDKKNEMIKQINETIFYPESNAIAHINYVTSTLDIIALLELEIDIACLSNCITPKDDANPISINQAIGMLDAYTKKIELYKNIFYNLCNKKPDQFEVIDRNVVNKFGEEINKLKDEYYSLNEKIEKAKNETKIEIDMGNFIVNMV